MPQHIPQQGLWDHTHSASTTPPSGKTVTVGCFRWVSYADKRKGMKRGLIRQRFRGKAEHLPELIAAATAWCTRENWLENFVPGQAIDGLWTDYPFVELGDEPGQPAPIRAAKLLGWDGDKYVRIQCGDLQTSIKAGYLYMAPGRCGDVPRVDARLLAAVRRVPE